MNNKRKRKDKNNEGRKIGCSSLPAKASTAGANLPLVKPPSAILYRGDWDIRKFALAGTNLKGYFARLFIVGFDTKRRLFTSSSLNRVIYLAAFFLSLRRFKRRTLARL